MKQETTTAVLPQAGPTKVVRFVARVVACLQKPFSEAVGMVYEMQRYELLLCSDHDLQKIWQRAEDGGRSGAAKSVQLFANGSKNHDQLPELALQPEALNSPISLLTNRRASGFTGAKSHGVCASFKKGKPSCASAMNACVAKAFSGSSYEKPAVAEALRPRNSWNPGPCVVALSAV